MAVEFSWIVRGDLPQVLEIERASFAFPWNEAELLEALLERGCVGVVAALHRQVTGFVLYETHPRSIEIVNLAVAPPMRRKGVGRAIVDFLKEKLPHGGRNELRACVGDDSLEAQLFLQSQGFRATRILHNHFREHDGDAYVMTYRAEPAVPLFERQNRISHYFDMEI